jgi:hypothetical protein
MQELIEKLNNVAVRVNELETAITKWKENSGTIVVEKLVEVVKEVPVEVIREVEKIVTPDTTDLETKLVELDAKLGLASGAIVALTSVTPVVEKAVDVVGEAVIETNEAPAPSPATDTFVATEPLVTEEPAAVITAEAVATPTE